MTQQSLPIFNLVECFRCRRFWLCNYGNWFSGFDRDAIVVLLKAAKWVERITRHKFNPNCPSYGDRASLVEAGILTNTFPATPDAAN